MEQIEGLIVNVAKYKDYDAVIDVLTIDRLVSILIRGAYREKSPNSTFLNKCLYCRLELYQGKIKGYKLRGGEVLAYFSKLYDSYEGLASLNFVSEVTRKCLLDNDIDHGALLRLDLSVLKGLNEGKDQILTSLYFMVKVTKIMGIGLNLDQCVICGKNERLDHISFFDGGTVCSSCYPSSRGALPIDKATLVTLREIYLQDEFASFKDISSAMRKALLSHIVIFFEDSFSTKINSWDLLNIH
jgi:DNA repair protein RecO (recombination protein O)